MNVAAPQTRLLLVLGLVAAAALAAFMLMRGGIAGDETATPPAPAVTPGKSAATPKPAVKPAAAKPVKPVVVLNPGLPANLARALRSERVVVAAVFAPGAGDREAVAQARAGAKAMGAGFVTLNVLEERKARALQKLVGPISDPAVLVFKRPGTIVFRADGFADATTVAQAARIAGARAR